MTAISSFGAAQFNSPLSRLQSELTSQVSAGTISSDDQSALSSALTDIDSALRGQRAQGGPPPSPDEMQFKINDLIENEVKSGKLTSSQADELKNVFAKAFQGAPGAGDPAKADGAQTDSLLDLLKADSTSESSGDDASQLISEFLKLLQESQASSSSYSANGSSLIAQVQSLVVDTAA